jgi:hypothetical protein
MKKELDYISVIKKRKEMNYLELMLPHLSRIQETTVLIKHVHSTNTRLLA